MKKSDISSRILENSKRIEQHKGGTYDGVKDNTIKVMILSKMFKRFNVYYDLMDMDIYVAKHDSSTNYNVYTKNHTRLVDINLERLLKSNFPDEFKSLIGSSIRGNKKLITHFIKTINPKEYYSLCEGFAERYEGDYDEGKAICYIDEWCHMELEKYKKSSKGFLARIIRLFGGKSY